MIEPGFYDDGERSRRVGRERARAADRVNKDAEYASWLADAGALMELIDEGEPAEAQLEELLAQIARQHEEDETKMLLSGPHDDADAIITVTAGAGGTDAQDWAEMVLRMYMKWCESKGFETTVTDRSQGDIAGIKGATVSVRGDNAYGYLRAEGGVHRLIRISPFDKEARRQTAFASLHVYPDIGEDIEIDIDEKDLRVDTYRSSGAGGQHVNVTDSAIRITHVPTNTVVTCQNERSQHANRATAMRVLKAKLYEMELEKQRKQIEAASGEKKKVEFGSQIRSYFMHPTQRVKDHRTGTEVGNLDPVLNGDLDPFIRAWLTRPKDAPVDLSDD